MPPVSTVPAPVGVMTVKNAGPAVALPTEFVKTASVLISVHCGRDRGESQDSGVSS